MFGLRAENRGPSGSRARLSHPPVQSAITRVDIRRKALVPGHRREQIQQYTGVFRAERGAELVVMLTGQPNNPTQQFLSLGGDVQRVAPAISAVAATLEVSALLELVQVTNQPSRHHAQISTEVMLTAARFCRDSPQDARVRRG